jgi:hypothetical protein
MIRLGRKRSQVKPLGVIQIARLMAADCLFEFISRHDQLVSVIMLGGRTAESAEDADLQLNSSVAHRGLETKLADDDSTLGGVLSTPGGREYHTPLLAGSHSILCDFSCHPAGYSGCAGPAFPPEDVLGFLIGQ